MKKKITIYVDDAIEALINAEVKNKNISINKQINDVLAMYYKQKLKYDNDFSALDNEEKILKDINRSLTKIQKLILYSNHLLNGGLPIFTTNTDMKILRPTENLKTEARKKTAVSYANYLKGEMSKEDYFASDNDDTDKK